MRRATFLALSVLVVLTMALPGIAQQAADDAYRTFYNEMNPQTKAELGEKFLADFKDSTYRAPIFQLMIQAYAQVQNWAKIVEHAEKLDTILPNADNRAKTFVYQNAIGAAQQMNDAAKIIELSDKLLVVDPQNLPALIMLATTIPARLPAAEAEKSVALVKGVDVAKRGLEQVELYFSQSKPSNMTDEQWKQARIDYDYQLHEALGLLYFHQKTYPASIQEFATALKSMPKDGVAHYYMGLGYQYEAADASKILVDAVKAENAAKTVGADQAVVDELAARRQGVADQVRMNMDQAIDELATAVAIGGVVAQPARDALVSLWKTKNNDSMDGLDQFIEQKKTQIGA